MCKLVMKDLYIHKRMIGMVLIYSILISVIASFVPEFSYLLFVIGNIIVEMLSISMTNYYDDKNNTDVLLASFPVKRNEIVIGKYLSIIAIMGINTFILFVCTVICSMTGIGNGAKILTSSDFVYAFYVIAFLFSFYYPLLFKFGYMKMRLVNIALYFSALVIPSLFKMLIEDNVSRSQIYKIAIKLQLLIELLINCPYVITIFFILILGLSSLLSVKIYRKRELY